MTCAPILVLGVQTKTNQDQIWAIEEIGQFLLLGLLTEHFLIQDWQPKITPSYGVKLLIDWVKNNIEVFK